MGVIIRNGRAYTPSQVSTLDELPQVGAQNQLYIVGEDLYLWDVDSSQFVLVNHHFDNFTIKKNGSGVYYGAGADLVGEIFTINNVQYTCQEGTLSFNEYNKANLTNLAIGYYSTVFGKNNQAFTGYTYALGYNNKLSGVPTDPVGHESDAQVGGYNFASGKGNTLSASKNLFNTLIGNSNGGSATTLQYNFLIGLNNAANGTTCEHNFLFGDANQQGAGAATFSHNTEIGSGNKLSGNNLTYNTVFGASNIVGATTATYNFMSGQGNNISGSTPTYNTVFGYSNNVVAGTSTYNFVTGYNNRVAGTTSESVAIFGDNNTIGYNTLAALIVGRSNQIMQPVSTPTGQANGGLSIIAGEGNGYMGVYDSIICGQSIASTAANNNKPYIYASAIFGVGHDFSKNTSYSLITGEINNVYNTCSHSFLCGQYISVDSGNNGGVYRSAIIGQSIGAFNVSDSLIVGSGTTFSTNAKVMQSIVCGYGFAKQTGSTRTLIVQNSIVTGQGHVGNVAYSSIGGYNNIIGTTEQGSYNTQSRYLELLGSNITIGEAVNASAIFGENLNLGHLRFSLVVGDNLSFNKVGNGWGATRPLLLFGKYNGDGSEVSGLTPNRNLHGGEENSTVIVGNGSSADRRNALILSKDGLLQLCGTEGNVVSNTGNTLDTLRTTLTTINADNASYTFANLPKNGQEVILSDTYTVDSIEITSISNMGCDRGFGDQTVATTSDYNSVIIFKKGTIADAESIMTNFTATDSSKIYLLNKDIDVSDYTVIHVMLFNDGFHICAIVAGYNDIPEIDDVVFDHHNFDGNPYTDTNTTDVSLNYIVDNTQRTIQGSASSAWSNGSAFALTPVGISGMAADYYVEPTSVTVDNADWTVIKSNVLNSTTNTPAYVFKLNASSKSDFNVTVTYDSISVTYAVDI